MKAIRILAFVSLIICSYYFSYYIFLGITQPIPSLGDSWDYHIPISQSILDGRFLHPTNFALLHWYPGSSEAINAVLITLRIPLTLSNILAIFVLGISCYYLAVTFKTNRYYAMLFALTFITLNAVVRWMNAVSIDIWVAIYFIWLIILLEKPKKTLFYFLKLGFFSGMLIGSKYTALFFFFVLFIVYIKKIFSVINLPRIIVFLIPFSIFGLFWYVRNYIYIQNPFYPIPVLGLPGTDTFGGNSILIVGLQHPLEMLNAGFAEYKFWLLSIPIALGVLINNLFIKKTFLLGSVEKLFLIGLINLIFFFKLPTSEQPWIMVSSFRYSYPIFIPLILGVFLLATRYKKETLVGYVSIAGMINVLSMAYYPKLILLYLPLAALIYFFFFKK